MPDLFISFNSPVVGLQSHIIMKVCKVWLQSILVQFNSLWYLDHNSTGWELLIGVAFTKSKMAAAQYLYLNHVITFVSSTVIC